MMKTIYIDWESKEILTEKEFEEGVAEESKKLVNDDTTFEYWLECNFSTLELWELDKKEKVEAFLNYKRYCDKLAKENLLYEFDGFLEKFEIEV